MTDSPIIAITVVVETRQTSIINFNMQPRSVTQNGSVAFSGYLTRTGSVERRVSPTEEILSSETIEIWYLSPWTGLWENTGVTATTHDDNSAPFPNGNMGFFSAEIGFPESWLPAGASYQFRAHYAGNTAKKLLGCGENDR